MESGCREKQRENGVVVSVVVCILSVGIILH